MERVNSGMGEVALINQMGDALSVVNAARVSFGKMSLGPNLTDNDKRLIKYLWDNKHTSPFRHVTFTFHIKAPIFVLKQWQKHQVGSSFNEISGRYVQFEPSFYQPDVWRKSIKNVKQGSGGPLDNQDDINEQYKSIVRYLHAEYCSLLDKGVCREQARIVLPLSLFSECYWTCSLQALLHFITLRLHSHAQVEIQYYAQAIKEIMLRDKGLAYIMEICCESE